MQVAHSGVTHGDFSVVTCMHTKYSCRTLHMVIIQLSYMVTPGDPSWSSLLSSNLLHVSLADPGLVCQPYGPANPMVPLPTPWPCQPHGLPTLWPPCQPHGWTRTLFVCNALLFESFTELRVAAAAVELEEGRDCPTSISEVVQSG